MLGGQATSFQGHQGRFVSVREYLKDSNEVNPRPGKHDLEY